ncbi:hypothetical protein QYE76_027486 [Lolium multiflorum]|uniref:Aminotransferase-like plant mobile domain-containing protein n=1 Tax=Lolium multiflorum TaxID=4521 RepID=A0AAD8VG48_LOLMU|nr:hypothetical protein QYE76_027486 [Lolium multiflorum]
MNAAALTALVDRWRPETHTFHLRAGEMTPTLQDVSMILGLPIQGEPLCMNTASDGWREQMENLIGMAPPAPEDPKERTPAGASFSWIRTNFGECPEGANEDTIRTYTHDERSKDHYTEELDTLTAEQVDWEPYGTYYHIGAGMSDLNPKCLEEARFWRMRCPLICMWLVEYHQPHRVMRQFGLYQECPPQWQDTDHALHRLDRQRQRKITNWHVHHRGHVTAFQHCLEAIRNAGHVEIVPHDLAAFNNYLQWFHQSTRIELVNPAYDDDILDDPIEFDEVAQSQHDIYARKGRSTSIASELNFVRSEIQKIAEECEVVWDQSHRDEKPVGPLRHFIKNTARKMRRLANLLGCRDGEIATSSSEEAEIPDDTILSQSISRGNKQATRSAYQLKPRGKAPNRYTPEDYVNRGKKVVIEEDEAPPWRSSLRRMRNDAPLSSEEQEQQQQEPRQRTKRMAVRKQPVRTARRGGYKDLLRVVVNSVFLSIVL